MGSTTSKLKARAAEPARGEAELVAPPADPTPAEINWTLICEAGRERVLRVLGADVRAFVDVFCEVDPKLHAPCSEMVSALFVHLRNHGVSTVYLNANTVHCFVSLLCAAEPGIRLTGLTTNCSIFELLVLTGIRLKSFPESVSVPIHTRLTASNFGSDLAHSRLAEMARGDGK